jgi:hypothetical protein
MELDQLAAVGNRVTTAPGSRLCCPGGTGARDEPGCSPCCQAGRRNCPNGSEPPPGESRARQRGLGIGADVQMVMTTTVSRYRRVVQTGPQQEQRRGAGPVICSAWLKGSDPQFIGY